MPVRYRFRDPTDPLSWPLAGGAALNFASDWGTTTGNSDNAVQDGARWTGFSSSDDLLYVVAATAGFPTTNVLRVSGNGTQARMVTNLSMMTTPAVGESRWFRVYLKYVSTSNNLGNQHFLQPDSNYLSHPWNWRWQTPQAGGTEVPLQWILVDKINSGNVNGALFEVILTIGTVYRLEFELRRTATSAFKMFPRIYLGDSTTVSFDGDDFLDVWGGSATEGQSLTTIDPEPATQNIDTDFSSVELGNNGPAGASTNVTDFWQAAAFAASESGWCGPYTSGEAD